MAQEPNTDEEMNDMLLEEQVDPVSGNTAPVGALPSEVRDDIDIRVSENEYVIPAYAVRYFGEGFFDELLGAAEQGWDRIKEGDELPFRDDELETEGDDEEPKEGYAEGGNIPGAGVTVPQPVGGGFGGYGGTGARFSGFESRIYINPETGREMLIFFFNGKPMKRIPQGFRPKGETAVQEQQTVAAERQRDDDDKSAADIARENAPEWTKKQTKDWGMKDYSEYAAFMKNNDNPTARLVQNTALTIVGSLIGGTAGAIALPMLSKKAQQRQTESVNQSINTILKSGKSNQGTTLTNKDMNTLFSAQFEANTADMNSREPSWLASTLGITSDPGQSSGTPIFDQAFYKDDDDPLGIDIDALLPPSSSSDDGPSAAQIAAQNASNTGASTAQPPKPKTSSEGQDNNPNAPDNDPEDDGGYDFGSAYNYNKGGLIKK